jgi:chromate transporter
MSTNPGSTNPVPTTPVSASATLVGAKRERIGPWKLFLSCSMMTLTGFGGVLPFAYRMLVEQKRWVAKEEFSELLALSQVLPGPPVLHILQMIGHRDSGWRGGLAAVLGLVAIPTLLMMLMGLMFQQFGEVPIVRQALSGMSAAAASLLIVMGLKVTAALPRRPRAWLLFAAAFICLGIARLPFLMVIAVLVPLAVGLAWLAARAARAESARARS